eukprot:TRINITY_DN14979_c0_g1_i1.p1 TRINITY_DN14979_c0_g1~~TRINITY_DN14979_c0_g1_i1.p1  ORF type:complete len:219 (+),score=35.83 TRINITY_DN14979_c0_g1_i1:60-716(+)
MKSTILVLSLFVLFYIGATTATLGVDIAAATTVSQFTCLKNAGYVYAIIRCWRSTGTSDPNAPHSIANAWDGGMKDVDVYFFPCVGKSATTQVQDAVSFLKQSNSKYGQMWFDIESNPSSGCGWTSSTTTNCNFLGSLLSEARALGVKPGVYSSASQWSSIMGSSCTIGKSYPLWYAHYNNAPNFNDFSPFGGWTRPNMKQYEGDKTVCSVGVDLDYY